MDRFALRHRGFGAAAVALLILACSLSVATPGCGDRRSTPASQEASLSGDGKAPETAVHSTPQDQGEAVVPAGRETSVHVAPGSPSRIAPPSVSLRSFPGQGEQITKVRWIVNGVERAEGETLPPSLFARGDEIEAAVTLRSERGETLLETGKVTAANSMPAVTDVGIEPRAPVTGGTVRAVVSALDPDGDPLSFRFQWYVDNVLASGDRDSFSLKGVRRGSLVHVAVTPNDGFEDGAWKYSPRHEVVNALPVVTSQAPTTIPPSRVLAHTIVAEDPDGDPLTYTLVKGNERMTLAGPTLTWEVSDEDIGRNAEVVIRISDGQGGETVHTMHLTPKMP